MAINSVAFSSFDFVFLIIFALHARAMYSFSLSL